MVLKHALLYGSLGWKIFPIAPGKKNPPLVKWGTESGSNEQIIRQWWSKTPNANIGLACGPSDIAVLDIDSKDGKRGKLTLDLLEVVDGLKLSPTRMQRTPSGGLQYFYRGKIPTSQNIIGRNLWPDGQSHIDTRGVGGAGGYVLLPGSFTDRDDKSHTHRGMYEWFNGATAPIAPLDQWVVDLFAAYNAGIERATNQADILVEWDKPDNVKWAIQYLHDDAPPAIQGKGGELTTLKIAATLKDHAISEDVALRLMMEHWNDLYADPPWEVDGNDGLAKKINNAYSYATMHQPGSDTAEAEFDDLTKAEIEKYREEDREYNEAHAATFKPVEANTVPESNKERVWTLPEVCREWAYVKNPKLFVQLTDYNHMWDKGGFDDAFASVPHGKASKISKVLLGRQKDTLSKPDDMVYVPGMPTFFDNRSKLNLYKPSKITAAQGDTTLWNGHLRYLFADDADRDLVLNWCAWLIQNLAKKPKHALLVAGTVTGTGKTFIAKVLARILGSDNVANITEDEILSPFNEWAMRTKLVVIEELNSADRNHVQKKLHAMITEERIKINDKNVKRFTIDNCFGVYAMSNEDAAIPIKDNDRRYLVVRTFAELKDDPTAYGQQLHDMLTDDAAIGAIMWELQHRDVGSYSGAGRAPATKAKLDMIEAGMSDLDSYMTAEMGNFPFNCELVCINDDIIPNLPPRLARGGANSGLARAIASFLKHKLGGVQFPDQHRLQDGRKIRLWALHGKVGILGALDAGQRARLYEAKRSAEMRAAEERTEKDFAD